MRAQTGQTDAGNGHAAAPKPLRRFLPAIAVVCLLLVAWLLGWFDFVSLSSLIKHRGALAEQVAANHLLAFVVYFLLYAILVAVSFPGASLLTILGGFLFGGLIGGTLTVLAATCGAAIIFLIARSSFGELFRQRAGPFVARMIDGFNRDAFNYLLFLRLVPLFPFWVVNIVPGLVNMRLAPYVAATFLGIIPGTFAYAFIGAGLDSVIAAQEAANPGCAAAGNCRIDPSALVTYQLLIAMAALAVVALLPVIIKKLKGAGSK